jgi:hypothetical protein
MRVDKSNAGGGGSRVSLILISRFDVSAPSGTSSWTSPAVTVPPDAPIVAEPDAKTRGAVTGLSPPHAKSSARAAHIEGARLAAHMLIG